MKLGDGKYAVVLLGGSIGEKRISKIQQLTNKDIMDKELFSLDKAKEKAKRMNKLLYKMARKMPHLQCGI
jgi:BRCT domain type II-containing protein